MSAYDSDPGGAAAVKCFSVHKNHGVGQVAAPVMDSIEPASDAGGPRRRGNYAKDAANYAASLRATTAAGITRDSWVKLARHRKNRAHERPISIDEPQPQEDYGVCSELFACGTTASVSPIRKLADQDGAELRGALLSIQEMLAPDIFSCTRDASIEALNLVA